MTVYVDDSASGANDGTSWTDAYTSLESADSDATAGEKVLVANTHDEYSSGAKALNFSNGTVLNPVLIISTDPADDSYTEGARYGSSDSNLELDGHIRSYGMTWQANVDVRLCANDQWQEYNDGAVTAGDDIEYAARDLVVYRNVDLTWADNHGPPSNGQLHIIGGSISDGDSAGPFSGTSNGGRIFVTGVDMSGTTGTNLVNSSAYVGNKNNCAVFDRCALKTGWAVPASTAIMNEVHVYNSDDGTASDKALQCLYSNYYGTVELDTARYRDDGATYISTNYSYTMISNTNARELVVPLVMEIPVFIDLDADSSPSGATFKAIRQSTLMAVDGTPAGLTSDSKTWTGSDVGTKYKFDFTSNNEDGGTITCYIAGGSGLNNDDVSAELFEPDQVGGMASLRIKLWKPSTQISVCPSLEKS